MSRACSHNWFQQLREQRSLPAARCRQLQRAARKILGARRHALPRTENARIRLTVDPRQSDGRLGRLQPRLHRHVVAHCDRKPLSHSQLLRRNLCRRPVRTNQPHTRRHRLLTQ